jgi:hypothetical protein
MKFGLTVFSVLLLTARELLAQSDRASTTGTVKDASGAVISGVQVAVTNPRTALLASADTNAQGVYAVPRPGSRLHPVPSGEPARGAGVLHEGD